MDRTIMKKRTTSLFERVLALMLLVAGVQSAFASGCKGELYFKAPESWTTVYLATQNHAASKMTLDAKTGYYHADLETWPQESYAIKGFSIGNSIKKPIAYIDPTDWVLTESGDDSFLQNNWMFTCPGEGKTMYILENPAKPGETVVSYEPPDAKYIYIMIPPDDDAWMAAVPMVSLDGGKTATMMTADPDHCGWFYHVWFGEAISDDVVFMRSDAQTLDKALGTNGLQEEGDVATPIPLNTYFDAFETNTIYFIPDQNQWPDETSNGFYGAYPEVEGICSYSLAAIIYDTDASLHPSFSCDYYTSEGQFNEGCQKGALGISEAQAVNYVKNCIGVTSGIVVDTLGPDKKPHLSNSANANKCFPSAEIFDMMFNYTQGVNEMSCYELPFSRATDNKWEFDSDHFTSPGVKTQGGFYPVEQTDNAVILAADANQTPVPAARTKHPAQGPVFMVSYMRKIDPKSTEDAPRMDLVCKGPGWDGYGSHDCEGLYAAGKDLNALFPAEVTKEFDDVWCWGSYCTAEMPADWPLYEDKSETLAKTTSTDPTPRWGHDQEVPGLDGRNQQFCFESHANFVFSKGLNFSFRGDDDIWVFIDNKLAVDLGGTHLAAPGYVKLDNFVGKSGALVEGKTYDIDIFFCDRRTTMSNVRIKTNMYIQQKTGIMLKTSKDPNDPATEVDNVCLIKSGDGGCASRLSGASTVDTICDVSDIVSYKLERGNGDVVMETVPLGEVSKGCIDLTNPSIPRIKKDACTLGPGRYNLVVSIEGKSKKITFKLNGSLDVASRDAIAIDSNGTAIAGRDYHYVGEAFGGEMIPLYISAIADPCEGGAATCSSPLEMDVTSAPKQNYTLDVQSGLTVYVSDATAEGGFRVLTANEMRTVGETGVDTIYVTAELLSMKSAYSTYTIGVTGRTPATVAFYAPKLMFMEDSVTTEKPITGDTPPNERWVGSFYDFYIAAFKCNGAGECSFCDACNFNLQMGSQTSAKIEALDEGNMKIVNGKAMISIRSQKEYRYDTDPSIHSPATIQITGENPALIHAEYTPIYFREPPVPFPVLVDIFDAQGAEAPNKFEMPSRYAPDGQKFLDGIADSIAIYYNRNFAKDSLPDSVFVYWENEKDSVAITKAEIQEAATCETTDENGVVRCLPVLKFGGKQFSKNVKTAGTGKVSSWAKFEDKKRAVVQAFDGTITDRIAPIIMSAIVRATESQNFDKLEVTYSEPVTIETSSDDLKKEAFNYYLNSATDLSENARYRSARSENGQMAVSDVIEFRFRNDDVQNPSPHVGDYIRFRTDLVTWKDTVNINVPGADTLRPNDGIKWNSPTDYASTDRLPSPWVLIEGASATAHSSINLATSDVSKKDKTPIELTFIPSNWNLDSIKENNPNTLGLFLKTDMKSLSKERTEYAEVPPEEIYLDFEMNVFTNLGGFVAHKALKVACTDTAYFGAGNNCLTANKNVFVSWNGTSDKNRLVGAGAYIVKWSSYVVLGKFGKQKKMTDNTEVWGIRHGNAKGKSKKK